MNIAPGGDTYFVCAINSFVHVFMWACLAKIHCDGSRVAEFERHCFPLHLCLSRTEYLLEESVVLLMYRTLARKSGWFVIQASDEALNGHELALGIHEADQAFLQVHLLPCIQQQVSADTGDHQEEHHPYPTASIWHCLLPGMSICLPWSYFLCVVVIQNLKHISRDLVFQIYSLQKPSCQTAMPQTCRSILEMSLHCTVQRNSQELGMLVG